MKQLSVLFHPEFGEVRSVKVKGETWFVAKDVCEVLGISKYRDSLARLDDGEKGCPVLVDTLGGDQEMATINESGLYHLIILSRKPEAKEFRRWVTHEVLPSIRKVGFYVHPSARLTTAQQRKLSMTVRELVKQYITDQDVARCAKRCGRAVSYVRDVLSGWKQNNGVMDELQKQAIRNKEQMGSPYSVDRLHEVVKELSR